MDDSKNKIESSSASENDPAVETGRHLLASIGWNPEDFEDAYLKHFPRALNEEKPLPDACGSIGRIVEQFRGIEQHNAVLKALTSSTASDLSFERKDNKLMIGDPGSTELSIKHNGSKVYSELWDNQIGHKSMVVCQSARLDYGGLPRMEVIREPVE